MIWPALGINLSSTADTSQYDSYLDYLYSWGFRKIRSNIISYQQTGNLAQEKAAILRAKARGFQVLFGVSSNSEVPAQTITAANWPTFRQAILDAATWAQANSIDEFTLGNEEEQHVDGATITATEMSTNIRALAQNVKAIYSGPVSYNLDPTYANVWITDGKGAYLDKVSLNMYSNSTYYPSLITSFYNAFTTNSYISEFNINTASCETYSADQSVQAVRLNEMMTVIKNAGYSTAYFFKFNDPNMGALKSYGGEYRLMWNPLTTNQKRWWFINV